MSASTISTFAVRSIRAPILSATRRQLSTVPSAASNTTVTASTATKTAASQHSTQKLAIASTLSAVAGIDVTYAYFTYVRKA